MSGLEEPEMNIIDRRAATAEGKPINVIKVGLFAILFLSVFIGTSLYLTADDTAEIRADELAIAQAEYREEFSIPMQALLVGPLPANPKYQVFIYNT